MITITLTLDSEGHDMLNRPMLTLNSPSNEDYERAKPREVLAAGWIIGKLGIGSQTVNPMFDLKWVEGGSHAE
jgi:hypothetical protein